MLGTVVGIVDSFVGCDGQKSTCMAAVADRLSQSIWFTALGLLVGLISFCCHRYLIGRLDSMDREMDGASLDLVKQLAVYRRRFGPVPPIEETHDSPMFGERPLAELSHDRKSLRYAMVLTVGLLIGAWCLQAWRYFYSDFVTLSSVAFPATLYVLVTFGFSWLPAYPVWKLLRRRPGGLAALASAFCFCWNLAEWVWGVHFP
jgi:hypothetical protein